MRPKMSSSLCVPAGCQYLEPFQSFGLTGHVNVSIVVSGSQHTGSSNYPAMSTFGLESNQNTSALNNGIVVEETYDQDEGIKMPKPLQMKNNYFNERESPDRNRKKSSSSTA